MLQVLRILRKDLKHQNVWIKTRTLWLHMKAWHCHCYYYFIVYVYKFYLHRSKHHLSVPREYESFFTIIWNLRDINNFNRSSYLFTIFIFWWNVAQSVVRAHTLIVQTIKVKIDYVKIIDKLNFCLFLGPIFWMFSAPRPCSSPLIHLEHPFW